jgi:hypothetical protein
MVNNSKELVRLACQLSFSFLVFLTSAANAQNLNNYYTSLPRENGILYFILPQSGFKDAKTDGKLTYDITYNTGNEWALINFSYYDKREITIDSVAFITVGNRISNNANKLFVERKKTRWHFRYSTNLFFHELEKFFTPEDEPKIRLYTNLDVVELYMPGKAWKRKSSITKKIVTLIKQNR